MPLLKTDDDARHVPSVWLGDPSLVRWPFDASYGQWILGFALTLPTFTVLGLFVPVSAWGGLAAWFFGKFITRRFPDNWPSWALNAWTWRAVAMVFFLLLIPHPFAWIKPVNIVAAALLTPVATFLLVRRFSRFITPMTPLMYWIGVLWKILTRPRSPREESQTFTDHTLEAELDFDLDELPTWKDK